MYKSVKLDGIHIRKINKKQNMVDLLQSLVFFCVFYSVHGQILSSSACFGTQSSDCDYFTLECGKGKLIKVLSALYGVKESACKTGRRCRRGSDGCCAYREEDCHEYFTELHSYDLYRECSFKNQCGPLQATRNILASCDNQISTYVYVEYECIDETTVLPFCDNSGMSGSEVNLVFDSTTTEYEPKTRCDCFVFYSSDSIDLTLTDVRMNKRELSGSGSDCSSAVLSDLSQSHFTLPQCANDQNEEVNFVYNEYILLNDSFSGFELSNLYLTASDDEPTLVWLSMTAPGSGSVTVTCTRAVGTTVRPTTLLPVTTTPQGPTNGTLDGDGDGDGDGVGSSNTGAIVAGVLVSILIVAIIAAVIVYILWKRKKKGIKHRGVSRQNSYVGDGDVDREMIYDEIGHVETVQTSPIYDPVYEPGKKADVGAALPNNNEHTYQNEQQTYHANHLEPSKEENKRSKNPLRAISSQTSRFFAWFRSQTDSQSSEDKKRGRESGQDSYDHIRAGNRPVIVRISSPDEVEGHVYSHQPIKPTIDNPVETRSTGGRISRDMSAINVGDSYIEFTFDKLDKNSPNLVRKDITAENSKSRPVPPTRPPPSPSAPPLTPNASPKLAPSPRLDMTSQSPRSKSPFTDRPKSPMLLSPDTAGVSENNLTYDYAESQPGSRKNSDASKSDISDHSYRILEKQEVYDYADMDDDNHPVDTNVSGGYSGSSMYEDVDEKLRAESVKKHKSSADVQDYEVPVSHATRPLSTATGQKPIKSDMSDKSPFNKELLKKKLRPIGDKANGGAGNQVNNHSSETRSAIKTNVPSENVPNSQPILSRALTYENGPELDSLENDEDIKKLQNVNTIAETSGVMKSDNVFTKDYEKAVDLKGVRDMAKLFESKA